MSTTIDHEARRSGWKYLAATMAAALALVGAQGLAPSSAQAMMDPRSEEECNQFMGTWDWFNGICDYNFGAGAGGDGDAAGGGSGGDLEVGPGGGGGSGGGGGAAGSSDDDEVVITNDETDPERYKREIAKREREFQEAQTAAEAERALQLQQDLLMRYDAWRSDRREELARAREMMRREQKRNGAKKSSRQGGNQRQGRPGRRADRN